MNEKEKILEEIGFSKAEALVYLTLLKTGKTKSGELIKRTSLQSSVVHNSLNSLVHKGFISYILKGKIKNYFPLDPGLIQDYIESKKQEFNQILPELKLSKETKEIAKAEIYEGFKGIFSATLKMIENSKKGEVYKYFAAKESFLNEEAIDFFTKVDMLKKEKKIIVRGISNEKSEILKKYKSSEIKFTNQEIPPAMNIFQDKILIISLSEKPIAILIHSKEIAEQYNKLWDSIWKNSKD